MKILKRFFELKNPTGFTNDHRQAKRYELMLKLAYFDPVTKTWLESCTKNISRNGLMFPVNSRLPKGALLDIKVEDPNSNKYLLLKGRVAWLEEFVSSEDAEGAKYETGVNLLRKRLF